MLANVLQNFCSYNINRMVPELPNAVNGQLGHQDFVLDSSQEGLQEGRGRVGKEGAMEATLLLSSLQVVL